MPSSEVLRVRPWAVLFDTNTLPSQISVPLCSPIPPPPGSTSESTNPPATPAHTQQWWQAPPPPARVAFRETSHSSRHQGPQSSSSLPGTRPGTPRTTYHQPDTQPSCQHSAGAGDRETKLRGCRRRWYPTSLLVPPHRVSQSASQSPTHDRQTRPAGRLVGMPSLSKAGRHTIEILKFTRSMWKKESRMYVSSDLIPISSLFRGTTPSEEQAQPDKNAAPSMWSVPLESQTCIRCFLLGPSFLRVLSLSS